MTHRCGGVGSQDNIHKTSESQYGSLSIDATRTRDSRGLVFSAGAHTSFPSTGSGFDSGDNISAAFAALRVSSTRKTRTVLSCAGGWVHSVEEHPLLCTQHTHTHTHTHAHTQKHTFRQSYACQPRVACHAMSSRLWTMGIHPVGERGVCTALCTRHRVTHQISRCRMHLASKLIGCGARQWAPFFVE
jgi:hypothetical protein